MKEYKKLMKKILKNDDFTLIDKGRKNTVKLLHNSGSLYSIHPGDKAVKPLQNWVRKISSIQ